MKDLWFDVYRLSFTLFMTTASTGVFQFVASGNIQQISIQCEKLKGALQIQ